ncbi:conserved hypothetical protein [Pirellula staleyi DSM 6068]|uniref:Uncharacterized protein n=1 Tax=Pirellula staleyi (strain ATCC 27377 / DSM 6068 / ICPB 4128) TaxID=530564 RepID=D2R9D5_PIRSD|nr:alpha/beta fold hydrolase [Pirellula staleyi]ADB17685.1 conserved hypothetical protein [Pirellula staleyi DSM 6068]
MNSPTHGTGDPSTGLGELDISRDLVIVVHGLGANRLVMTPLCSRLSKHVGRVINWGYSSLWRPVERPASELVALLHTLKPADYPHVHLVTHSMGGIVARLAIREFRPENLGRFVMTAPPNGGSHVATRMASILGRVVPPVLQLRDAADSFVRSLPPPEGVEVGIIAAHRDALIARGNTQFPCEVNCEHIELPGRHSSLVWRPETAAAVVRFLKAGRFFPEQNGSLDSGVRA